jgi:hypothetical protein
MSETTWYYVSKSGRSEPVPVGVIRETEHYLVTHGITRQRKIAKVDGFGCHYPDLESATAAYNAIVERNNKERDKQRIKEAAPDLLEALESALAELEWQIDEHPCCADKSYCAIDKARAAIAKARGE